MSGDGLAVRAEKLVRDWCVRKLAVRVSHTGVLVSVCHGKPSAVVVRTQYCLVGIVSHVSRIWLVGSLASAQGSVCLNSPRRNGHLDELWMTA
jgi:hypothetical protein